MNTIKNKLMDYGIWILLTLSILLLIIALILVYQTYDLLAEYNSFNVSQKEIIPVIGTNVTKRKEIELVARRGDSYKKIENFLESNNILNPGELKRYLVNEKMSLEGIVFEGSYHIPRPSSPEEVVSILTYPYKEWVETEYSKYEGIDKSPLEIITIASMIEKEAALDEERPIIAGVIYNRLNKNMKLQIDATVIYALGEHKTRLSWEDLEVNSPYNTYIVYGLPPTPICTPGSRSIEAALNPASHSYYYYVLAGYGNSHHNFSETYEEHLKNVQVYLSSIEK
ncbi:MAG TPA: endolytic transglycosylase MltG [Defluviitaleaceae bacterium]|nr:endolytic transglycosylase MltG [Defluviitaleaceae bacterium]HPT76816.1 endolytic transglycosylase MltG [Defluviitaleaceae bacterium]